MKSGSAFHVALSYVQNKYHVGMGFKECDTIQAFFLPYTHTHTRCTMITLFQSRAYLHFITGNVKLPQKNIIL